MNNLNLLRAHTGSKNQAVITVFTFALTALLVTVIASPAAAERIGPQLPGMMLEFDDISKCVPQTEAEDDGGDNGNGGDNEGDGPPPVIFAKADPRSGFTYTAPSAGTIKGFSIQTPVAYNRKTCVEVVTTMPLRVGVLRAVPGSEYKYTVVHSEKKMIESSPIGKSSVIRNLSIAPMPVQAGDMIAFGAEPGFDYEAGDVRLNGFFAIGEGSYEDDLVYGCLQPMLGGASLQCIGPLNPMAANDGDMGPEWASVRMLMNADFEPAPAVPQPPVITGGPACKRIDYKATLKTYKSVGAKHILSKGVPVEIDANQSGKATVDVLLRTGRDVTKWLGKGKKAKRLIARKRIKLTAGKTSKSNLRLSGAARSQLKKALRKKGHNTLRLLVKAKLELGDKKLSKANDKRINLSKNTNLKKSGGKPKSRASVTRSSIGSFTDCAVPLKIKVKKVGGSKLKWSDLTGSKGVRVQLEASSAATVKLKLAIWGRSLVRLGLAKKSVSSSRAKALATKGGIDVGPGKKVVYKLKLSSSQRKRLKRASSRSRRIGRTTVYFKLQADGVARDVENRVRDSKAQTLKLRVGR